MFPAMALVGPRYKRSCRLEVYLEPRAALADQIVPPCHGCRAFRQTGITRDQPDRIELNEAFAARALAVMGDLKLDPSKVNPLGGAIALGHPLGATGAVRIATLVHGMRRRKQKYGMVNYVHRAPAWAWRGFSRPSDRSQQGWKQEQRRRNTAPFC